MIDMVNVEVEYGEGCLWRIGSDMVRVRAQRQSEQE